MAVTRGFLGRRSAESSRIPPGQYLTRDFPVLSAGPTPYTPLDKWSFTLRGTVDERVSWSWAHFQALPHDTITFEINCVTK
jgi:DMSO/TMAO reductase YedYZ molybdopterin-dependent catalytic subunit